MGASDELTFLCEACQYLGVHAPIESEEPWSEDEIHRLTDEDRRRGEATCPRDGASSLPRGRPACR